MVTFRETEIQVEVDIIEHACPFSVMQMKGVIVLITAVNEPDSLVLQARIHYTLDLRLYNIYAFAGYSEIMRGGFIVIPHQNRPTIRDVPL
jgi:hypothetical protein